MSENVTLNEAQKRKHDKLLLDLLVIRKRLMRVNPQTLTLEQHTEWNTRVFQVGLAIIAMEKAVPTSISAEYANQLPNLVSATERLERELQKLKSANNVISAVSAALGTITSITTTLP